MENGAGPPNLEPRLGMIEPWDTHHESDHSQLAQRCEAGVAGPPSASFHTYAGYKPIQAAPMTHGDQVEAVVPHPVAPADAPPPPPPPNQCYMYMNVNPAMARKTPQPQTPPQMANHGNSAPFLPADAPPHFGKMLQSAAGAAPSHVSADSTQDPSAELVRRTEFLCQRFSFFSPTSYRWI